MEYGISHIMKHFMENIKTGTLYPTLNSASTKSPSRQYAQKSSASWNNWKSTSVETLV